MGEITGEVRKLSTTGPGLAKASERPKQSLGAKNKTEGSNLGDGRTRAFRVNVNKVLEAGVVRPVPVVKKDSREGPAFLGIGEPLNFSKRK